MRAGAKVVVAAGLTLIAVGLLLMTGFEVDSSYGSVALSYVLLGMGIGLAMTPATDSVMGSLPLAKASVGSAVNDATRTTANPTSKSAWRRTSAAMTVPLMSATGWT